MHALVLLLLLCPTIISALLTTIRNDIPRLDQYGNILNAHDGSVVQFSNTPFNGTYFMYGTVYENCTQHGTQCTSPCGYNPNRFALYTTTDLAHFTLYSDNILPDALIDNQKVNYWMPVVSYNALTSTYVMNYWTNRCGFSKQCTDIATSSSPYGPFKTQTPITPHGGIPSSQMGFFTDSDGKGYIKYNTGSPQHHAIELLSDDWLSSTGIWSIIFWKPSFAWMEGGGMFKHGDLYY